MSYFDDSLKKILRESYLKEMPEWMDSHKNLGNELGENIETVNKNRKMSQFEDVENLKHKGMDFVIRQRRDTYMVDVFDGNRDLHVGEFIWFYERELGGFTTESAAVSPEYQGYGIASFAYIHTIEEYMRTLYSDDSLTGQTGKGSFDLWVRLSKHFPNKYLYNDEESSLKAVDTFTRDMMGSEHTRFVVSTEELEEREPIDG